MKYLIVAVLVGGLSIAGLLAQKSDQPKTPTTDQSQTSTGQSQTSSTDQSNTAPSAKSQTFPPAPSKSKKAASKGKSKAAAGNWGACQLPPQTTQYSFWQSCTNVALNSCTLNATCQMANGQSRAASFDTNLAPKCPTDYPFQGNNLVNNNGYLCCGYAGMGGFCGQ
jgi:cytoskeletal protein RodZ